MSRQRTDVPWRGIATASCGYVIITLALFRNLLPVLRTHLYGDLGDPLLNTAILAWNAKVTPLTGAWWNFPSFAPLSGVTAWTEHLLGAYLLTSPIIWSTGNAVLAYNTLQLVCFPLNGLCAFLLVREVTGSSIGAFIGGLAFAFAPFHAEHVTHVQLLMAFGMPLALYGLHVHLRTGTRAALAWFAFGWFNVLLSNAYLLIFFPILLTLWCLWFLRGRPWSVWAWTFGTAFVTSLPAVPLWWGYYVRQAAYGFSRPYSELTSMSADMTGVIGISQRAVLWKGLLPNTFYEGSLFPGLSIAILAVLALVVFARPGLDTSVGVVPPRRSVIVFYFAAALAMWSFTLGPEPAWSGVRSVAYGPYWVLLHLPLSGSIRVPARAWLAAVLCLAVCAGAGASWLAARPRRSWVVVPIAVAIVSEGWFVAQTNAVPTPGESRLIPADAIVLDLPLYQGYQNTGPQYLAVLTGYRVVNGYSGYAAPHFASLRDALAQHRPEALDAFRRRGDLYVLVRPEVDRPFLEWLESQRGIETVSVSTSSRIYRLPRLGHGPATPLMVPLPKTGQVVFTIE